MNPLSIYKNQIKSKLSASKSEKPTIHIKDIHKLTPIPTAIKLKTPEPLKSHQECSIFDYPILDIVNTNFNLKMKSFTKIAVCPYFVTNCKNRYGVYKPYIQYLLYKYPESKNKTSNLLVFPFVKVNSSVSIKKTANKLIKKIVNVNINPTGFIQSGTTIYVFYDMRVSDQFEKTRAEQQWLKLIKKSNELWWVIMDEICNHRKTLNFPIHHSVTDLFLKNPILIYLKQNNKTIDIPIVAYYGNYYKFLPIIASLGQKPTTWPNLEFGPYFYFTNYTGAFRYAGWTKNYKQRKVFNREIADDNGKLTKGGIIRFALFMDKTKVLLDTKSSKVNKYINNTDIIISIFINLIATTINIFVYYNS